MRFGRWMMCGLLAAALAGFWTGCGIGPQAGQLAQEESALLATEPADDAGMRQALLAQVDAWNSLAVLLVKMQLGGKPVGEDFRAVVLEVGQLARRQRDLIQAGQDDPATNRAVLAHMKALWVQAGAYLNQ